MGVKEKIGYIKHKLRCATFIVLVVAFIISLIWSCQQGIKDRAACKECIENFSDQQTGELICCSGLMQYSSREHLASVTELDENGKNIWPNESCLKIACDWGN